MPEVFISRYGKKLGDGFSKPEIINSTEVKPQHSASKGQSRSGWLSDLLNLRKVVILCCWCRAKFNPRKHGYRRVYIPDATGKSDGYTVNGTCDWCKQETALVGGGTAFQPEEIYKLTTIDPSEARRVARLRAKEATAWRHIQKVRRSNHV